MASTRDKNRARALMRDNPDLSYTQALRQVQDSDSVAQQTRDMAFSAWLLRQAERNDLVGDLACDFRASCGCERCEAHQTRLTHLNVADVRGELDAHNADPGAYDALDQADREWQGNGLPLPTALVNAKGGGEYAPTSSVMAAFASRLLGDGPLQIDTNPDQGALVGRIGTGKTRPMADWVSEYRANNPDKTVLVLDTNEVRGIAVEAIRKRLGPTGRPEEAVFDVVPEGMALVVHVNSGGNAIEVRQALTDHGYQVDAVDVEQPDYGVRIHVGYAVEPEAVGDLDREDAVAALRLLGLDPTPERIAWVTQKIEPLVIHQTSDMLSAATAAPEGEVSPMVEVTHLYCPESGAPEGADNSTHHLVPRSAGRGAQQMVCRYCGKTEKALREAAQKGSDAAGGDR